MNTLVVNDNILDYLGSSIFPSNNIDNAQIYFNESAKSLFIGYAKSIICKKPSITIAEIIKTIMEVQP